MVARDLPRLRVLVVGDLGEAHHLYGDVLGLPVLRQAERGLLLGAGAPPVPALALCPASSLRIGGARRLIHALLAAQGGSWAQIATADLDATLAGLTASGALVVRPPCESADGSRAGAALDPWENTLRLVQRAPPGTPR
jgi:hypothetical protein